MRKKRETFYACALPDEVGYVDRRFTAGRRDKEGQGLVAELAGLGAEAIFVPTDVRNEHEVRDLVDKAVARFGHLDVAVDSAGTEGKPGPVTEQTAETYAATFDTNVLGMLLSMKHELRVMIAQRRGSIVNVSSTYGHTGAAGASVYAASKHAVEGLTKSATLEAAESGVRVNMVSPGPVETGMLKAIQTYGGRYLARLGEVQVLEGSWSPNMIVIVEFPDLEQARAWYRSPEYAFALEGRDTALSRNLILVDGVPL